MGIFDFLFKRNNRSQQINEYLEQGAVVVDVRTPAEFSQGSAPNAINIPLHEFKSRLNEVTKIKSPVILCCKSGVRSAQATSVLRQQRTDCVNGGSWQNVKSLMN